METNFGRISQVLYKPTTNLQLQTWPLENVTELQFRASTLFMLVLGLSKRIMQAQVWYFSSFVKFAVATLQN